jgi:hypothetical protein
MKLIRACRISRLSVGAGNGSVFGNWWYSSRTSPSPDFTGSFGIGSEIGVPSAALRADVVGANSAATSATVTADAHQCGLLMRDSLSPRSKC